MNSDGSRIKGGENKTPNVGKKRREIKNQKIKICRKTQLNFCAVSEVDMPCIYWERQSGEIHRNDCKFWGRAELHYTVQRTNSVLVSNKKKENQLRRKRMYFSFDVIHYAYPRD